jgi:hypothetical protein
MEWSVMTDHIRYKGLSNKFNPKTDPAQMIIYEIRIKGHLGSQWSDWFEGQTITLEDNGDTLITGPVIDQAALYGLLKKVRDLGMPLISINRTVHIKKINKYIQGEENEK